MADVYPIQPGAKLAPLGADEVGGKAWNLMRMAEAGLPVPPAFVLPTDWCARHPGADDAELGRILADGITLLEQTSNRHFGGERMPLLVSVRSGAAISMPGMMETVLDVGLNSGTVAALIRQTGNPRLAWDSYRRLVQAYASVVADLPNAPFDQLLCQAIEAAGVTEAGDLDYRELRDLTRQMLDCFRALTGNAFPTDPITQLHQAAAAVFRSWDAEKAKLYRRLNHISDAAGTAVTVQMMVYGNAGNRSGAGVGFTRNPATGADALYFDMQFNGQGEDVVAGRKNLSDPERLRRTLPKVWQQLQDVARQLEKLFGDVQDFEFTIEAGILYLLQTRRAKRTDWAAVTIAVDRVGEGVLSESDALKQLAGIDLGKLARTRFAPPLPPSLAIAQITSLGVISGVIALDSVAAKRLAAVGQAVILVRHDTETSDIEGIEAAAGILTASGGRTSHAAVVARQLNKVCLVACPALTIDLAARSCRIGATSLPEGAILSLDGDSGAVYAGSLPIITERPTAALATIAGWTASLHPL
jgi:pyruvate,orthophosphate dikinase